MIFSTSHRKNNTISSRIWKYMVSLSSQGVSLSAVWTFDKDIQVVPVSPPPTPALWTINAGCISFNTTNTSSIDMQGTSDSPPPPTAAVLAMDMQGVSVSPPPTPAVWTCRVYQFHHRQHQQY
jgi:hypothetical protein